MMKLWRHLCRLSPRASHVKYEQIRDEERFETESELLWRRQRTNRLVAWPSKAAVFLFLANLVIVGLLLHTLEPLITLLHRNEELFSPRVDLPSPDISHGRNRTAGLNNIPLILHQTTATETIPDHWIRSQKSCKQAYSEFEYKLWTDASARDFVANHYPWFLDTLDNYAFPIQRADSIRYFFLYHYGGIYLDMDTWCNQTIPIHKLGSGYAKDYALFKSTLPTGITNDLLVASARHPVYAAAIAQLPVFNAITRTWARLQPHCAIMISAGPMFLTMVVKDYLLAQSSLPSKTVGVVNATELAPFITDLESSTWHRADTKVLTWIGDRPWTWFSTGAICLTAGLFIFNRLFMFLHGIIHKNPSGNSSPKVSKAA
ncbi:hypothetical protein N7509_000374 [Penicillium cosmopolitanum]|uniref:Mannosyl phosphorylinositol ceramide synthase SUR1 n=1 Tax=Penicillium cosmopolitanum TaxID=1131564 RepID=A0A9X0BE12_9EURO|nr:uncharacterized protein N7509_000374 [Penicillium cosmopolitanum]KAJ5413747.1 hypothetical protein N7509_000374 [Penicillium cosmopolitanum]